MNATLGYRYLNNFKTIASFALLAGSVVILVVGVAMDYNKSRLGGPLMESILLILAFALLYINEGYQVAVLKVQFISDDDLVDYQNALSIKRLVFPEEQGGGGGIARNKLPNLFLGQSFCVVTATFLISQISTFNNFPTVISDEFTSVFFRSGLVGIIATVNLFQILPSVVAQKFPRQFLERTPLVKYVIMFALFIENTGIVHATYSIVQFFEWTIFNRRDIQTSSAAQTSQAAAAAEPSLLNDDNGICSENSVNNINLQASSSASLQQQGGGEENENLFFKIRKFFSLFLTLGSLCYLIANITSHRSSVHLHPILLLFIVIVIYIVVFYCEGVKIAIVSSSSLSKNEMLERGYFGHFVAALDYLKYNSERKRGEGCGDNGINEFLLGRQLIVVPCGFIISNIFLFVGYEALLDPFIYFILIGLGLPGILVTMQLCQLAPQILAGRYTKQFLGLPGSYFLVKLSTWIEMLGITSITSVLSVCVASIYCGRSSKSSASKNDNDSSTNGAIQDPNRQEVEENPLIANQGGGGEVI